MTFHLLSLPPQDHPAYYHQVTFYVSFPCFPIKSKFLGKAWKALHNISQFNAQVLGDRLGLSTISQIHHAYSCFVLAQSDTGSEIGFLNFPTQQTSTHPLKLYSGRCDRFIFCAVNQYASFFHWL